MQAVQQVDGRQGREDARRQLGGLPLREVLPGACGTHTAPRHTAAPPRPRPPRLPLARQAFYKKQFQEKKCPDQNKPPPGYDVKPDVKPKRERFYDSDDSYACGYDDYDEDEDDYNPPPYYDKGIIKCECCRKELNGAKAFSRSYQPYSFQWSEAWRCRDCVGKGRPSDGPCAGLEVEHVYISPCATCSSTEREKSYFFGLMGGAAGSSSRSTVDGGGVSKVEHSAYCQACWPAAEAERAEARKLNPIGYALPLSKLRPILERGRSASTAVASDRETLWKKERAGLCAWLAAQLAPSFAALRASESWQSFDLRAADDEGGADLEAMLSKPGSGDGAGDGSMGEAADAEPEADAAESFADYQPSKLDYGPSHIEHVVESASLACVPPVDVTYKPHFPPELLSSGALSRVQLEAVVYALQQHERRLPFGSRAGFYVGDGTGVGKGREGAAVILENFLLGRKRAVWFTCNTDLAVDAKRDLRDIGAVDIPLLSLTSAGYGDLAESFDEGVLVVTYSVLVASSGGATRFDQLMKWLTPAFDGVLLFDEAHKAKGAAHGQPVGTSVVQLQASLPNARVMYLSATGATQVGDMSYMTRLGLWGTGTFFQNFKSFQSVLTSGSGSGSSGSMEMLAVQAPPPRSRPPPPPSPLPRPSAAQLKSSGAYLARSLGLRGVDFHMVQAKLTPAQQTLYDQSASLWVFIHQQLGQLSFLFRSGGTALNSAQSKFFQQLLLSFKATPRSRPPASRTLLPHSTHPRPLRLSRSPRSSGRSVERSVRASVPSSACRARARLPTRLPRLALRRPARRARRRSSRPRARRSRVCSRRSASRRQRRAGARRRPPSTPSATR